MKSVRLSFFTSRVGLSVKADSTIIDSCGKQLIQIISQQSLWIMHTDFVISVHPKVISTGYFTDNIQSCSWMSRSSSAWGLIMIDKQRIISLLKSFTRVRCDTSARVQIHAQTHERFGHLLDGNVSLWEILLKLLTQEQQELKKLNQSGF